MSTLFDQIFCIENLEKAYRKAQSSNGKYKADALKFSLHETENIMELQRDLYSGTYAFSGYIYFKIYEPKERDIYAPHFRDKIVQLALNQVLMPYYLPKFIPESYACLTGRGAHKAASKVQENLIEATRKWGDKSYIVKLDVKKFFYSINRQILKETYRLKIKDEIVLRVMDTIVDSAEIISTKGIPLGNTLSQLCSNIYLDRLDQAAKRYWQYALYVRYADDIIICVPSKNAAVKAKHRCKTFLKDRLDLELNANKSQIMPIKNGVNAYGYKIWSNKMKLRDESKRRIKRKIKAFPHLIAEGRLTVEKANQMLASWQGHAKHGDSYHFIQSLLARNPHVQLDKEGVLKIDESKI